MLNTARFGIDGCVELIAEAAQRRSILPRATAFIERRSRPRRAKRPGPSGADVTSGRRGAAKPRRACLCADGRSLGAETVQNVH